MSVYFAVAGPFVKIGRSYKPAERMEQLRRSTSGGAVPNGLDRSLITLAATVPGDRAEERAMHDRFIEARAAGEWFHATPELLAFIDLAAVSA